jgi:hypothetical protein
MRTFSLPLPQKNWILAKLMIFFVFSPVDRAKYTSTNAVRSINFIISLEWTITVFLKPPIQKLVHFLKTSAFVLLHDFLKIRFLFLMFPFALSFPPFWTPESSGWSQNVAKSLLCNLIESAFWFQVRCHVKFNWHEVPCCFLNDLPKEGYRKTELQNDWKIGVCYFLAPSLGYT